jgi:acetoin utilization protein AcuC
VFYNEKILTISLHHLSSGFYPGTGRTKEVGEGYGKGYAINVPLPFRTGDKTYLKAYKEIALTALDDYRPDMIVHQFGVDAHFSDPLVGLGLTTHAYEDIAKLTHEAAHKLCNGQYMVVGGGGYNLEAVPRCWAIMFCTISGVYPKDPKAWEALHDPHGMPEPEEVPGEVDETIRRLKAEVLPLIK